MQHQAQDPWLWPRGALGCRVRMALDAPAMTRPEGPASRAITHTNTKVQNLKPIELATNCARRPATIWQSLLRLSGASNSHGAQERGARARGSQGYADCGRAGGFLHPGTSPSCALAPLWRPAPLSRLFVRARVQSFRPITVERPKVLLPLVNAPLLEYTLEWLALNKIEEVCAGACRRHAPCWGVQPRVRCHARCLHWGGRCAGRRRRHAGGGPHVRATASRMQAHARPAPRLLLLLLHVRARRCLFFAAPTLTASSSTWHTANGLGCGT